jgi:hypothetical protein
MPTLAARSPMTHRHRPDGTRFRSITPLEAIYYHERLDLITHPLIKGLITWKWDHFAGKYFYIGLAVELFFLISWTCTSLLTPFPIRYIYRFPQDVWRCILWTISIVLLIWQIGQEMFDVSYARQRYEDYIIWESERTDVRNNFMSTNQYKSIATGQVSTVSMTKSDSIAKMNVDTGDIGHSLVNEGATSFAYHPTLTNLRSHHSQQYPLPAAMPTLIKGKPVDTMTTRLLPIDNRNLVNESTCANTSSNSSKRKTDMMDTFMDSSLLSTTVRARWQSRLFEFARSFRDRARTRLKSYYMYYSLNNLFDWIIYILCIVTLITHCIDVSTHTVVRARIHMYTASITVISMWFRFMVFFRTITISMKTLRSKLVEIKLGELVIMVG